jgi:predicted ATPase with chaperone activity
VQSLANTIFFPPFYLHADLKKAGPAQDLPIALGILLSSEQVSADP